MKVLKMLGIGFGVLVLILVVSAIARGGSQTPAGSSATVGSGVGAPTMVTPSAPAKPAGPLTEVTDGLYEVGVDVVPGRYKTAGPSKGSKDVCTTSRQKDDTGDVGTIIAIDSLTGQGSVTVKKGEFWKLTTITFGGEQCRWVKQ